MSRPTGKLAQERGRVKLRLALTSIDDRKREAARRAFLTKYHPRYRGQAQQVAT